MVDLNHGSNFHPAGPLPPERAPSDALTALIDDAVKRVSDRNYAASRGGGEGDVALKRIGASYIGVPCTRDLAYRYHRVPKEERGERVVSAGELKRHALSGFWTEAAVAEWLREAGFDIRTRRQDGKQFGYKVARGPDGLARIAGEIDGVILATPAGIALPAPCLWESKKGTKKKFSKFVTGGVAQADPTYYGQVQTNMAYLEVERTLFSMLCLDDMKFHWEVIEFDAAAAQALTDRAVAVISTREPEEAPRIASAPDFHLCRQCDYQKRCWGKP
jgi:hypothetical protein